MTTVPSTTITTIRDLARALSRAVVANPTTIQATSMEDLSRITTQSGSIYDGLTMLSAQNSIITFDKERVGLLTQALELMLSSMLPPEPSHTLQIRAQYLAYSYVITVVMGEPR